MNADNDILCCSECQSVLAIMTNIKLSPHIFDKLCKTYRQKIAFDSHSEYCSYRLSSAETLDKLDNNNNNNNNNNFIPVYMLSVLPREFIQLIVDHPTKTSTFIGRRMIKLYAAINPTSSTTTTTSTIRWRLPKLESSSIPKKLHDFVLHNKDSLENFLSHAGGMNIENDDGDSDGDDDQFTTLLVLSILGWEPIPHQSSRLLSTSGDSRRSVSVGCSLCYSTMDVELRCDNMTDGSGDDDDNRRPSKRHKRSLPSSYYNGHRHYCPYKCGFPNSPLNETKPIYEVNTTTTTTLTTDNDGDDDFDESVDKVRQILRSGIVPKTVDLSTLSGDDD
jgi:hypothetical protein